MAYIFFLHQNGFALCLKTPVEKGDFINGNIKLKYGQIKVNVPSKSRKIILGICLPCKRGCLGHKVEFSQTAFRVKIENVRKAARAKVCFLWVCTLLQIWVIQVLKFSLLNKLEKADIKWGLFYAIFRVFASRLILTEY